MTMRSLPSSNWAPILLTTGIAVVIHIAFGGDRFAIVLHAVRMGGSTSVIGVITAMLSIGSAIASAFVGRWLDRSGVRGPFIASAIMLAVAPSPALMVEDEAWS